MLRPLPYLLVTVRCWTSHSSGHFFPSSLCVDFEILAFWNTHISVFVFSACVPKPQRIDHVQLVTLLTHCCQLSSSHQPGVTQGSGVGSSPHQWQVRFVTSSCCATWWSILGLFGCLSLILWTWMGKRKTKVLNLARGSMSYNLI